MSPNLNVSYTYVYSHVYGAEMNVLLISPFLCIFFFFFSRDQCFSYMFEVNNFLEMLSYSVEVTALSST